MGRPGRYTLSVMAWVAAYAGWSSIIGLVVAAITGEEAREVSSAWSALLTVVGPLVPTLVALWFNDWARDGFPTREQVRAARRAVAEAPAPVPAAPPAAPAALPPAAPPRRVVADATIAEAIVAGATNGAAATRTVPAHVLGVPGVGTARTDAGRGAGDAGGAAGGSGGFPVAPLVRD